MATSCSHEEVPRPKALSGQSLEYNLSKISEERADCESVCKVRIRSCTPVTCLRGTSLPLQCYSSQEATRSRGVVPVGWVVGNGLVWVGLVL